MASFVSNNWKGHLYISVSKLFFKNALGLLINNRSNFREERIIVRKITATFREERVIARKFTVNHWARRIIIWKIAWIKTIGVIKVRGNFLEISFQAKCLRKARKFVKICLYYFSTILYFKWDLMLKYHWKTVPQMWRKLGWRTGVAWSTCTAKKPNTQHFVIFLVMLF